MKTQLFFVLCLALLFTACEKDADFAPAVDKATSADLLMQYVSDNPSAEDAESSSPTSDYCINLSSTHWLSGFGKFQGLRQTSEKESYLAQKHSTGMYTIEATGAGFSAELARNTIEAKLTFNSRTKRLSGIIITTFYKGEVLEQQIDSDALVVYERGAMIVTAKVDKGVLDTGSDVLSLVRGEVVIALPLNPEGWFEANLYATGMYCTSEIK